MLVKIPLVPKVALPSFPKLSSLVEVKPTSKSSFPLVKILLKVEKGTYTIAIPDELVDHSIKSMS